MNIIQQLMSDFPGHTFEEKKGMFGSQIVVDGKVITNTWQLKEELEKKSFAKAVKKMSAEDTMYTFIKKKVAECLK